MLHEIFHFPRQCHSKCSFKSLFPGNPTTGKWKIPKQIHGWGSLYHVVYSMIWVFQVHGVSRLHLKPSVGQNSSAFNSFHRFLLAHRTTLTCHSSWLVQARCRAVTPAVALDLWARLKLDIDGRFPEGVTCIVPWDVSDCSTGGAAPQSYSCLLHQWDYVESICLGQEGAQTFQLEQSQYIAVPCVPSKMFV